MRILTLALGNLLFLLGVAGLIVVPAVAIFQAAGGVVNPLPVLQAMRPTGVVLPPLSGQPPNAAAGAADVPAAQVAAVELAPTQGQTGAQPDDAHLITGVRIPRINLDAPGALAKLVQVNGGATWEVPAYKAGHGEYTAGAGQAGNAVLMGHVTSLNAGNVFRDLDRVRAGDTIDVSSGAGSFTYRVTEVKVVPRTDLSVVQPTTTPALTLITCAGAWLPQINEFAERLIVRAELAG